MKTNRMSSIKDTVQNNPKGQSLVEFALVVGLIVVVMLGSFEIFNLLQQKADLDKVILQTARQAGEFGGVSDLDTTGQDELESYIRLQLANLGYDLAIINEAIGSLSELNAIEVYELNDSGIFVKIPGTTECQYGQFIRVNIEVDWDISLPIVLFFDGVLYDGSFDLTATARCWRAL